MIIYWEKKLNRFTLNHQRRKLGIRKKKEYRKKEKKKIMASFEKHFETVTVSILLERAGLDVSASGSCPCPAQCEW